MGNKVTNTNSVLDINKNKMLIVNMNIDGFVSAMGMKKLFPECNIIVYYVRSHAEGNKIVDSVLKIHSNDKELQELYIFNIKISVSNVNELNKAQNSGVNVFYYSYLFEPTALIGMMYYTPGTLTCESIFMSLKEKVDSEVYESKMKDINYLIEWATTGMLYETGTSSGIDYIEEVQSLVRDCTKGINTLMYCRLLDILITTTYSSLLEEDLISNDKAIYYMGRKQVSPFIVKAMNLHSDAMHSTIPEIINMAIKGDIINNVYLKDSLKYVVLICSPNFNKRAKHALRDNDVVLNINLDGWVQIRTNDGHDARSIAVSLGANPTGNSPVKAYAFGSGLKVDLSKVTPKNIRKDILLKYIEHFKLGNANGTRK